MKHSRPRRLPVVQVILVAGLLALTWFAFGNNVLAPARDTLALPRYLGSLALDHSVQGEEALAEINKLHGTSISLASAVIAQYGTGSEQVMVWIGGAQNRQAAESLVSTMVKGIEKGNSPFSNPRALNFGGNEVWQTDGPGGKFFFYRAQEPDNRVIWLSIQSRDTTSLLERALKAF